MKNKDEKEKKKQPAPCGPIQCSRPKRNKVADD
jgi:hypothetical protein